MLYNLLFTALPPIAIALFDQELSDATLMREPRLYRDGIFSGRFNRRKLWLNIVDGVGEAEGRKGGKLTARCRCGRARCASCSPRP